MTGNQYPSDDQYSAQIKYSLEDIVAFTQRLVQTPSESGKEQEIADIIAEEMKKLDYDEVVIDPMGNVIGTIKGTGGGKTLLLSGHIDHAEPGAMEDPYSAKRMDGKRFGVDGEVIYGRAAVDMKGAVACMVYAAAAIKASGISLAGDVIVAGNPMEETSGADGAIYMLDVGGLKADGAICGEATGLGIYLGHRGNAEVKLTVKGVMAHGSNPGNGINAAIKACQLVCYIMDHHKLPSHPLLGPCTSTILDIKADTERKAPVLPDRCYVYVDRRFLPGETKEDILREFETLISDAKEEINNLEVSVEITKWGLALYTPEEEPITQALINGRTKTLGEAGSLSAWIFGTDGAFIADRGIPCVGFGPGDEAYAHTPEDHIPIDHLDKATKVYIQTALEFCK